MIATELSKEDEERHLHWWPQ